MGVAERDARTYLRRVYTRPQCVRVWYDAFFISFTSLPPHRSTNPPIAAAYNITADTDYPVTYCFPNDVKTIPSEDQTCSDCGHTNLGQRKKRTNIPINTLIVH